MSESLPSEQRLVPSFDLVAHMRPTYDIATLAAEPSLFSCSMAQADDVGGDITQLVLERVRATCGDSMQIAYRAGLHEVIDVRVQRLMPGMYPSIPGWHCDSVPRANYFSQPDFSKLNPASFHVTVLVDSDETGRGIANTAFLGEPIDFSYDSSAPLWKQLHQQVESTHRRVVYAEPGRIIKFDSRTVHKATACVKRGWRYFFRMSMYHNPPIANKVQSCLQVYILSEENGW